MVAQINFLALTLHDYVLLRDFPFPVHFKWTNLSQLECHEKFT